MDRLVNEGLMKIYSKTNKLAINYINVGPNLAGNQFR